jgi:hypothetical protein
MMYQHISKNFNINTSGIRKQLDYFVTCSTNTGSEEYMGEYFSYYYNL